MISICSRRSLMKLASIIARMGAAALTIKMLGFSGERTEASSSPGVRFTEFGNPDFSLPIADIFPTQPPEVVREMVTVALCSRARPGVS